MWVQEYAEKVEFNFRKRGILMLKSIKEMLVALDENHILYCHWKSNEHLTAALNGDTDLDMLFLPTQRSKLECILNSCGLKRFHATPLMQYNAIEDYIGFDFETSKIWHLHLHYKITLGEKHLKGYTVTPWGVLIINNRIYSEQGIYISCYEDELLLFFIRNALKFRWRDAIKKISSDDMKEMHWLLDRIDGTKFRKHAKEFLDEQSAEEIINLDIEKLNKKVQLKRLQGVLRKRLKSFSGYSHIGSWWTRSRREWYWAIGALKRHAGWNMNVPYRRFSPSGGSVVAFLGSDGAGKSTTIAYVKKEFSKKIDVKTIYLGSGDGSSSILRKPMKMIARRVGGKGVGHAIEKEYDMHKKTKNGISLKARIYNFAKIIWAITLAKEKKKKLRQVTKARNAGMLVLLDRYPQVETPGFNDGPLLGRYLENGHGLLYCIAKWELGIYKSAAYNPPDMTIKLVVPTEVAIIRKPEMTKEEIENKKKVVMAMELSPISHIIDTSVELTKSVGRVMNEIWQII